MIKIFLASFTILILVTSGFTLNPFHYAEAESNSNVTNINKIELEIVPPPQPISAGEDVKITLILKNNLDDPIKLTNYSIKPPYNKTQDFLINSILHSKSSASFFVTVSNSSAVSTGNNTLVIMVNTEEGYSTTSWINVPIKDETPKTISERLGKNLDAFLLLFAFYSIPIPIVERLLELEKKRHMGKKNHKNEVILIEQKKSSLTKLRDKILEEKYKEVVAVPSMTLKEFEQKLKNVVSKVLKNDPTISEKERSDLVLKLSEIKVSFKESKENVKENLTAWSASFETILATKISEKVVEHKNLKKYHIKLKSELEKLIDPDFLKKILEITKSTLTEPKTGLVIYDEYASDLDKEISNEQQEKRKHQAKHETEIWLKGVGIAAVLSSFLVFFFDVGILQVLGYDTLGAKLGDLIIISLFISSGSKPFHDLIGIIKKVKG